MGVQVTSVLVVDEHAFFRQSMENMLNTLGISEVLQAEGGKQGLQMLRLSSRSKPVEVVMCDLEMDDMDSLEFLRHLYREFPDCVVIIASELDVSLINSVEKMVSGYGLRLLGAVEKPLSLTRLQNLLSRYQGNRKGAESLPPALPGMTLEKILEGIREGQFEPYFQPNVNFETGYVCGVEALARWVHPEHGVVLPHAFIDMLDQNNQLEELTYVMLQKATIACKVLHDNGLPITVSVNLSLSLLSDANLADTLARKVKEAGLDPKYIVFEITETAAMTNTTVALENLARLRIRGFGLCIDDYGTGYSSIQQLSRIAFTQLKIDRSFVKNFREDNTLRIIVESSIEMARKLDIKSVAEGVETQRDWVMLKHMGCDMAQGYFIAKPMPLNTLVNFCADYKAP